MFFDSSPELWRTNPDTMYSMYELVLKVAQTAFLHINCSKLYVHTVTARVSVPVVELKGCKKNESRELWALVQKHTSFKVASHTGGSQWRLNPPDQPAYNYLTGAPILPRHFLCVGDQVVTECIVPRSI
jgi:hypothetical protein